MLKLKNAVKRDLRLTNGEQITVDAEVHGDFIIHGQIKNGKVSDRAYQVTHMHTSHSCLRCKNISTARKSIKLLQSSGIDWTAKTIDQLKADPEKLKAAYDLIREFRL